MKKFLRILAYIKPYWVYAMLNVVSNILVIVFSLVTFVMLIPFLNLLFGIEELVLTRPEFHFNAESVIGYLNFIISKIIIEQGKVDALIFICLFLLGTFFFRNLCRFLAMFFLAKVRVHAVMDIRDEIYHKILILPLSYYNHRKKGDIMSRITTDVQEVD
ncbi:MAG: ABC transporter ATP-binding protein, partial [Bacteroidales bacterium]|nr:ABC transporter ATP-binding protein [Bacteroidales bacterium]